MKILITGDEGFIGRELKAFLEERGYRHNIIGIDKKSGLDICDPKVYEDLNPQEIKAVIHLAAISSIKECEKDPREATHVNEVGTMAVVNFCKENKIPMIFASSAAVYGETDKPSIERLDGSPQNLYAWHKKQGEYYIWKNLSHAYILRFSNVFGKRNDKGVVYKILQAMKDGSHFRYSDGVRDYVWVLDVCSAIRAIIDKLPTRTGVRTYNISSGVGTSVKRLVESSGIENISYQPTSEVGYSVLDNSLFRTDYKWEPTISVETFLKLNAKSSYNLHHG